MSAHEFRDDDNGYMEWRAKHPDGYVINIHQSYSPIDAHLHDASCSTLITPIEGGLKLTNQYVKVCGETLAEVEDWAADHVSEAISPCGICRNVARTVVMPAMISAARSCAPSVSAMNYRSLEGAPPATRTGHHQVWADWNGLLTQPATTARRLGRCTARKPNGRSKVNFHKGDLENALQEVRCPPLIRRR